MSNYNLKCEQQTRFATMCRILYQMFHQQIDAKRLEDFKNCDVFSTYAKNEKDQVLNNSLEKLNNIISQCNDEKLCELQNDYNQLFIGPNSLLAPPWGSIYVDPYEEIFNNFTINVDNYYRKNGLELDTGIHEPADHLGIMFAFLSLLFSKLIDCLEQDEDASYYYKIIEDFTSNYILIWSNVFLKRMESEATTSFYKNIAVLAGCVLSEINNNICKK